MGRGRFARELGRNRKKMYHTTYQNPTKGHIGFSEILGKILLPVKWGPSKRYIFFSIKSLLSLKKYVRQKFSFCMFPNGFCGICLSPILFTPSFQKSWSLIAQNCVYWWETDKLKLKKNEKFECFRCFFIPWLYTKLQI